MALEPEALLKVLDRQITDNKRELDRLELYYEGEQPLRFVAPVLEDLVGGACAHLVLNWPQMVADAYDERSDIEGFRKKGDASGDADLWDLWQASAGDQKAPEAHVQSLISGVSYVIVGTGEDGDPPAFTVEHGLQCAVRRDPRNRKVTAGLKRWRDDDEKVDWANLYLPNRTITYRKGPRTRGWVLDLDDEHDISTPLIVPLPNRGRIRRPDGRSEFLSILPLADAANKIATDMMTSAEHHAIPRRWMLGMSEDDFTDENGNAIPAFEAVIGKLWGSDKKPGEAQFGQFQESDLLNFHNTIRLLAQLAAQLAGLPQDYMSFTSDNPTSADALRAAEARFVKRCERKHVAWGDAWEDVMRLMWRLETNQELDAAAMGMETLWRDPATPTKAQMADATVKLVQAKIIPVEQAREDLGYTSEQRERMAEMDAQAVTLDPLGALAEQFRAPTAPVPGAEPVVTDGVA